MADDDFRRDLSATLESIEGMLAELPMEQAKRVRKRLQTVRELLVDQRPPRLALVGRRGSGKSSLVNALYGEPVAEVGHVKAQTGAPRWFTYETDKGSLEFLDTRGFQEAHLPEEEDTASTSLESILLELEAKCPDAVLFLVKATEVGAAVDEDLAQTERVLDRLHRMHGVKVPLLAVITQCDLLEPKDIRLHRPEEEDERDVREKQERVKHVERVLEDKIRDHRLLRDHLVRSIGVSAYQSWRPDGSRRSDQRWRIDELVTYLYDKLPEQARMELVRLAQVKSLQRRMARSLTTAVATMCGGLAFTPIPVADIAPITSLQAALVVAIGYVGGRKLTTSSATEFMGALGVNVGAGFALREAARALVKLIPGAGNFVSATVAFGGTWAIGAAAIAYFIDGANVTEARRRWREARHEADEMSDS
ncbi:MAG: GTPase [Polyangiaceae bacterium]